MDRTERSVRDFINPDILKAADVFRSEYEKKSGFPIREGTALFEAIAAAIEAGRGFGPPIVIDSTASPKDTSTTVGNADKRQGVIYGALGVKDILNDSLFGANVRAAADADLQERVRKQIAEPNEPAFDVVDEVVDIVAAAERIALDKVRTSDLAWEVSHAARKIAEDYRSAEKAGRPDDVAGADEKIGKIITLLARIGRRYGYTIDEVVQSFLAGAENDEDDG